MDTGTGVPTTLSTVLGVSLPLTVSHLAAIGSHRQALSAFSNLLRVLYSIPGHTLPTLETKTMHQRHITTAFCVLYEYFVSEVSSQDKDRDKERVENAGGTCFIWPPWFNTRVKSRDKQSILL